MYSDTNIEICSPVRQDLAKEGIQNARDRLQCTKRYTQYLSVLSLSNLTNHFWVRYMVFCYKRILGIRYQRFYNFKVFWYLHEEDFGYIGIPLIPLPT